MTSYCSEATDSNSSGSRSLLTARDCGSRLRKGSYEEDKSLNPVFYVFVRSFARSTGHQVL